MSVDDLSASEAAWVKQSLADQKYAEQEAAADKKLKQAVLER